MPGAMLRRIRPNHYNQATLQPQPTHAPPSQAQPRHAFPALASERRTAGAPCWAGLERSVALAVVGGIADETKGELAKA